MIPEEVVQLTSVTTLKTARFENRFGTFHYQNVKTSLYFGYEIKTMQNGRGLLFATPEKALLDTLYLNPYYKTEQDMEELRLDEDFMQTEFNGVRFADYLARMENKALERRARRLIKVIMIDLEQIKSFFPPTIARESRFGRYMLKEYLQLLMLDHLATTPYVNKLTFIGDTNLRLIHGIDRFSEDLDFDCKDLSEQEFMALTDDLVQYLRQNNFEVETRDKANPRLTAYRRNLYFPQMLFNLGLTGHREERFLLKVEAQDQGMQYQPEVASVNKMGFFFNIQVPPPDALCAMKFCAIMSRQKGRDFYDAIFLLSKTKPNMDFLKARTGISSMEELKAAVAEKLRKVDMEMKCRDFVHLLFNERNADRIRQFPEVVAAL